MGGIVGSIGGLFGLDGGDDYSEPASSQAAASIASQLFNESTPLRKGVLEELMASMGIGGRQWDLSTSPLWAPGKMAIEDQYANARKNIMGNIPVGGQLNQSLEDMELGRSKSLTQLIGQIQQDMFNKSYGIATGAPQMAMQGLLGSAGVANQAQGLNMQQQAGKDQKKGDLGMAAAYFLA